jgi:hypothetical protein
MRKNGSNFKTKSLYHGRKLSVILICELHEESGKLIIQKVADDGDFDPVFLKAMENSYKRFAEDLKELKDR